MRSSFYSSTTWLVGWACAVALAHARPVAPALSGARPALPAPAADSSRQLVLTSGKRKGIFLDLSPGNGYALRFVPPAGRQFRLASIRVFLQPFGSREAKGKVRIRVASPTSSGAPAADDLLPHPTLLTEQDLQALDHPLELAWPAPRPTVSAAGFFIVVEGLGDAPDEYVLHSPRVVLAGPGNYQIGRRSHPEAPPRLVSIFSIPELWSAKPTTSPVDVWAYDGDQPQWKPYPEANRVPLLEAVLE